MSNSHEYRKLSSIEINKNKYYSIVMDNAKENFFRTTKHISNKLLMLRRLNNLTQEEFAEKINTDRKTISRAEQGEYRPSGETLEKICIVFNIPISYFYDDSEYKNYSNKDEIIRNITAKLNVSDLDKLNKINKLIDII